MSVLTSLLVRDQKVPVRKIEEAIQRQVIAGGSLDTVLLEGQALSENEIASYCAAVHRLAPATREECMGASRDVIRTVPSEVAERHRLLPLGLSGEVLTVAVTSPLSEDVEQQIGFLLGVHVEQRIAAAVRIAAGLEHHFGVTMVPRMRRLARKLDAMGAGDALLVAPLETSMPPRADDASTEVTASALVLGGSEVSEAPQANYTRNRTARYGQPQEVRDAVSTAEVTSVPESSSSGAGESMEQGVRELDDSHPRDLTSHEPGVSESRVQKDEARRNAVERLKRLEPADAARRKNASKLLIQHRGPLTTAAANEMLQGAESRDEILEITMAFLRQFFDVSGLFVVSGKRAEGLEIYGPQVDMSGFQRLAISLDEPSAFRVSAAGPVPVVTTMLDTDTEKRTHEAMGRAGMGPALILPMAIRSRVVLFFYGDRSGETFSLSDLPEPVGFAPSVSGAFQQLILRRKASAKICEPESTEEQVPEISVAHFDDSESHVRWSEPPPPPAKRRKRGRLTSGAMVALGVPRSAPPPPKPGSAPKMVAVSDEAERGSSDVSTKSTSPAETPKVVTEGTTARAVFGSDNNIKLSSPTTLSEPVLSHSSGGTSTEDAGGAGVEDDDFPELVVEEEDVGVDAGVYAMSPHSVENVSPLRREPALAVERPLRASPSVEEMPPPKPPSSEREYHPGDSMEPIPLTDRVDRRHSTGVDRSLTRPQRLTPPETPSVIVQMAEDVERSVMRLAESEPEELPDALEMVMSHGEIALPVLVREFPGRLYFDRDRPHRRLPRGRDISPVARALAAFGYLSIPFLPPLLQSDNAATRFYAVLLVSEFSHARLVGPLGDRLFDDDRAVGVLALDVLRTLRPFRRELQMLFDRLRAKARAPRQDESQRVLAIRALGDLADRRATEMLVGMVEAAGGLAREASRALVKITRQDFGEDAKAWKRWLARYGDAHRIEWLILALDHESEAIRSDASEELKEVTREYFGYHPSLPKRERAIARRKYQQWWEREGMKRYQGEG